MQFNRRDLMKFFAAGTVIAPVVGGKIDGEKAARLIETPAIEPVKVATAEDMRALSVGQISVTFYFNDSPQTSRRFNSFFMRPPTPEIIRLDVMERVDEFLAGQYEGRKLKL